jgi:hypothetical protein
MTAKEYLKQYEYADKRAKRLQAEYERELELIDSVRSTLGGDGMPHGSGVSRRTEDAAIRLSEKAEKWKDAQTDAIHKRQLVFDAIHDIDGVEGDVLYQKYINYEQTWEEIAQALHYSVRGIQYAHGRALLIVASKLD